MFSAIGDVFFEVSAGTVWWLSTATGALEQVAESREQFASLLEGDAVDEWFLPCLVEVLYAQGKQLGEDQCYTYAILPIFSEGSFSAENMYPVLAAEHFSMSGHLHESIRKLPDGAQVQVTISD
ncbi:MULTISPECIES: T6SS immunity protein Tdi1 domain-containing protein [unclassified Undibacterium]|uniref:T6SS immunity protein Tdi1 domain-containing protein n=1 Tax=unclassified Undibacterium TaxID=2630295 RepID=UPI00339B7614